MIKKSMFILIFVLLSFQSYAQDIVDDKEIKLDFYANNRDSLLQYAENKQMIPAFEKPTLIALSHYPELKGVKIIFVRKSLKMTAKSLPKWTALFQSRKNRVYKIYINNNPERLKGALLEDVPFDAQIGLIGHELGHIADYSRKGVFGLIAMGFQYCFVSGRSKIEKRVDKITIAHHLGWQLYNFDDFVFNRSKVSKSYKEYKSKVYYKPQELLLLIGKK